ncbi:DNA-processing protein DprA [Thiosulfatihalobacter marinus]|uniref:DNA-processing protein DprA n=1 Tax=Thiosulfatihalobacter marinus TaxID=2792481 RepID=UPI0018D9D970|nr:DNA-processing protein DprA [Thiosulfatihalobacter marinus]
MTEDYYSSTHPQLPPTTEEERFAWLRLLRSRRVGATTFHRLLAEHGSAQAALAVLPEVARAAGVEGYEICPEAVIHKELNAGRAAGARLITCADRDYPDALRQIADAPPILWTRGRVELLHQPMISLVGARNASSLGTRMARAMARDLGQKGIVVVSGLARGVDTAAHLAALPSGTVAVFAAGVDVIYPAENTRLADDIARDGLTLSEQPPGLMPQARHFPARNRIISGLARAVIVVEAAAKSGSIITARNALDQGREVLAVPGHPFDARAAGCNMLLRDGATLVRSAEDVIEALPDLGATLPGAEPELPNLPPAPKPPARSLRDISNLHMQILDRLGPSPVAEDQLIRDLRANSAQVAPALVDLELDGRIRRQSGGLLSRA